MAQVAVLLSFLSLTILMLSSAPNSNREVARGVRDPSLDTCELNRHTWTASTKSKNDFVNFSAKFSRLESWERVFLASVHVFDGSRGWKHQYSHGQAAATGIARSLQAQLDPWWCMGATNNPFSCAYIIIYQETQPDPTQTYPNNLVRFPSDGSAHRFSPSRFVHRTVQLQSRPRFEHGNATRRLLPRPRRFWRLGYSYSSYGWWWFMVSYFHNKSWWLMIDDDLCLWILWLVNFILFPCASWW